VVSTQVCEFPALPKPGAVPMVTALKPLDRPATGRPPEQAQQPTPLGAVIPQYPLPPPLIVVSPAGE
jgi:hypothetical protein